MQARSIRTAFEAFKERDRRLPGFRRPGGFADASTFGTLRQPPISVTLAHRSRGRGGRSTPHYHAVNRQDRRRARAGRCGHPLIRSDPASSRTNSFLRMKEPWTRGRVLFVKGGVWDRGCESMFCAVECSETARIATASTLANRSDALASDFTTSFHCEVDRFLDRDRLVPPRVCPSRAVDA